jgi:prephenate dehydrogenase
LGMIGFGRIGKLLARYFARDFAITVYDKRLDARQARALGARPGTLAQACAQETVLLCVPIGAFERLLRQIKPLLRAGALVIDTCSVKQKPAAAMKRLLPRNVEILATHPNFGPDSAAVSLKGHKIVVCPVRLSASRYRRLKALFSKKGLIVVEMSPREHDRQMATSLALTHFIGRGLIAFGARSTDVDTEGYKRLMRILQTVQNDTWELFVDMNRHNDFAAPMRRKLLAAMKKIDAKVRR